MITSTPPEFCTQMKNDVVRWSDVVRRAHVPMKSTDVLGDEGAIDAKAFVPADISPT